MKQLHTAIKDICLYIYSLQADCAKKKRNVFFLDFALFIYLNNDYTFDLLLESRNL